MTAITLEEAQAKLPEVIEDRYATCAKRLYPLFGKRMVAAAKIRDGAQRTVVEFHRNDDVLVIPTRRYASRVY